mmetsp:Transcript_5040/g.7596  ORF Transcript_5040/g.7596 Transcript_5040/m.7596 type:complete len:103 (-) Transcript_5040:166-474(-)
MHHTLMKSTANNLVKICYEFIGSFPLVKSSFQANLKKSINHVCSRKALLEKLAKEREEFQNSKFCNRVKNRFPNIARMVVSNIEFKQIIFKYINCILAKFQV